ncbi:MAG: hypothetical protein SFY80_10255 [Verrucomicrobiota bacterium]|nr:hypothetical protein [Verrucomicrobiota bacterium]
MNFFKYAYNMAISQIGHIDHTARPDPAARFARWKRKRLAHYARMKGNNRERIRLLKRYRQNLRAALKNPAWRNAPWVAQRYGFTWDQIRMCQPTFTDQIPY